SLTLDTISSPASLTVNASGILGESAPLTVIGAASFTAGSIDLTTQGNSFQGVVTLSSSGTISLSDSSALTVGDLTLTNSATLTPGLTPTGLTINGDLTLSPASVLNEQITKVNGTTQFSELNVSGAVNLGNATLQIAFQNPYVPTSGDQFQIVTETQSGAVTG